MCHRDDDISLLLALIDIAVRLGHLLGNNDCAGWRGRLLADDPFGHGQIDHSACAHQECIA